MRGRPLAGWGAYQTVEPLGLARAQAAAGRAQAAGRPARATSSGQRAGERASGARGWMSSGAAAGGRALWAPGVGARGGAGSALSPRPAQPSPSPSLPLPPLGGAEAQRTVPGRGETPAVGSAGQGLGLAEAWLHLQVGAGHSNLSLGFPNCTRRSLSDGRVIWEGGRIFIPAGGRM